ncbi:transposase, partial [Streptomyces sp. NPDC048362]|uniref:transposase n=1 Tax=Streptomyces sp. NPDC048362 TaxID=3365539 RepID=UPI003720DB7D
LQSPLQDRLHHLLQQTAGPVDPDPSRLRVRQRPRSSSPRSAPTSSVFPTADHLASWAHLSPRTLQSGPKNTSGPAGKGNPWLRGALGEAAVSAARTDTFLGTLYRRIVTRKGHLKALVAVAHSILVSVWHLMNDPTSRYRDLRILLDTVDYLTVQINKLLRADVGGGLGLDEFLQDPLGQDPDQLDSVRRTQ